MDVPCVRILEMMKLKKAKSVKARSIDEVNATRYYSSTAGS